jgi:glycosyltransferase involved in cell wall biosynthesis
MVTPHYFPHQGGVETHTYEVARRLVDMHTRPTVLTIDMSGALPAREVIEGVEVRRIRAWPKGRDYYYTPEIGRIIATEPWDIVHSQGINTLTAPLAMYGAWHRRIPYVVTFHTGGNRSSLRNAARDTQWRTLGPLLRRAARLIPVSRFERARFARLLGLPVERFTLIRNGAQLPTLPDDLPAREGGPLIVSVGRLERYKGHHRSIAALPFVRAAHPDARLLILGAGPYEAELHRQIAALNLKEAVTIRSIPAHERRELAMAVAGASVVALLSDYEAHPLAVLEALALGRPVLVADTSGLSELAEDGLVRAIPADSAPGQVAAALLDQIREPLLPTNFRLPTWDTCAMEVYGLYQEIWGGRDAAPVSLRPQATHVAR